MSFLWFARFGTFMGCDHELFPIDAARKKKNPTPAHVSFFLSLPPADMLRAYLLQVRTELGIRLVDLVIDKATGKPSKVRSKTTMGERGLEEMYVDRWGFLTLPLMRKRGLEEEERCMWTCGDF